MHVQIIRRYDTVWFTRDFREIKKIAGAKFGRGPR
jgi:hypothetical protein